MAAGIQNDPGTTQQEAGFGFIGRFWTESSNDNMTAKAGGALLGATLIDSLYCRFSTVTSPGDSAVLPPTGQGGALSICVINDAANAMTVYAQGSDTINGQAGATGVTQMGKSIVFYQSTKSGVWIAQGLGSGYASGNSASFPTYSTQTGVTATAAGTQANSVKVTGTQVQISVCVTLNDSVTMPPAQPGMEITIVNNGAASAKVWPASQAQGGVSGGDQVNSGGANVGFTPLVAGTPLIFYCFVAGNWVTK
jgi:hypothetical protein